MAEQYDVFVSYNRRDAPLARDVVAGLKTMGFRVWFDEEQIQPGDPWVKLLAWGIAESRATVVLIGAEGLSPWTATEVETALRAAVQQKHRVVPVLLPTAPEHFLNDPEVGFLKNYHFMNCRELPMAKPIVDRVAVAVTGRELVSHVKQIGGEFPLTLRRPNGSERVIRVFKLPNSEANSLVWLTWDTFGACIERLGQQLANYGYRINASACIGVNDAGLTMATFLGSAYLDRPPLGYYRCAGDPERPTYVCDGTLLPDLRERPTVLLVDFELKTGRGLAAICRHLRERYVDPQIYFATCGVMVRQGLTFERIEELEAYESLRDSGIVDLFVAATMNSPGIEPPLGLR